MNPKLLVRTVAVAALMLAGTAMATPMLHARGDVRPDRMNRHGTPVGAVDGNGTALYSNQFHPSDPGRFSAPEPSTLTLLVFGLAGLAVARRRRAR